MVEKTVFLAWQDKWESQEWFPIGRLDVDLDCPAYRFRYIGGAERAQEKIGFPPLVDFPKLERDYRSTELFPLFQNRIMSPKRPDFAKYVQTLDLSGRPDPIEILSVSGGYRVTDDYEVFPKLVKHDDGSFVCRFFLHGWRHVSASAQQRIDELRPAEELYIAVELTNPKTQLAVQIQTTDYQMLGWAPRYLVDDLAMAMAESSGRYEAQVVRVNPQPVPSTQRVLVELRSYWDIHEPMSGKDFDLIVK